MEGQERPLQGRGECGNYVGLMKNSSRHEKHIEIWLSSV